MMFFYLFKSPIKSIENKRDNKKVRGSWAMAVRPPVQLYRVWIPLLSSAPGSGAARGGVLCGLCTYCTMCTVYNIVCIAARLGDLLPRRAGLSRPAGIRI